MEKLRGVAGHEAETIKTTGGGGKKKRTTRRRNKMMERIPGWLNFILLSAFYYAIFGLLESVFELGLSKQSILIVSMFFAGGYLAKFREKTGGGWRFW